MADLKRKGDLAELKVAAFSVSLTNGKVRTTKLYTADTIDWLAAYEPIADRCFYVPAAELGAGMKSISLRLEPARNNQQLGTRLADHYERLPPLP